MEVILIVLVNFKISEIREVFNYLNIDPETRAVVLTGNGKSFCAGLDLKGILLH